MVGTESRGGAGKASPAFLALGCVGFIASAPAGAQATAEPADGQATQLEGVTVTDTAINEGSYKVDRKDKSPIEGRIVLGMVRDRGQPRIGLIAVTPHR